MLGLPLQRASLTLRTSRFFTPRPINRARSGREQATIMYMFMVVFAMRVVEAMFFLGLAGSTVVVIISFFEDAKELFGED
jgi:hypothetical protein